MGNSTVDRLRSKSTKKVEIKQEGETEPYEFVIQRLSTFELIESQEMSATVGDEDATLEEVEQGEQKTTLRQLKSGVFPLMKRFIPICTISPKIIFEGEVEKGDTETLHHRQIPMPILSELFNQILIFSGLDKASMDKIKKKQKAQLPKT
jgi:hypothetical protein